MTTLIENKKEALTPPVDAETIADLLHRLGDIPPERVRLHPCPGTATVQDVIEIEAHENRLFELVDGVLVEKAMGYWESRLAADIIFQLQLWLRERGIIGHVTGESGMMQIFPDQVRMPDVALAMPEDFAGGKPTGEAVPHISPLLVVEVISKTNTRKEIERKREEYFRSGTRMVWEVDPKPRTVTVFTSLNHFRVYKQNETLDGGTLLPGFTYALKDLFAILPGKPK